MQALIKPIVVIFCVLYGLLWFGVEFEDVKRLLNGGDLFVVEKGVQLGKNAIFISKFDQMLFIIFGAEKDSLFVLAL